MANKTKVTVDDAEVKKSELAILKRMLEKEAGKY